MGKILTVNDQVSELQQEVTDLKKTIRAVQDNVKTELGIHVRTILALHSVCVKQHHAMVTMSQQITHVSDTATGDFKDIADTFKDLTHDLFHVLPVMTTTGKDTGKKK